MSQLTHPKYRPDIDGLRAVAVLAVVAFHAFPNWVPGGFVGVDVFFVISGYLISSIIFGNLERGTFSYAEFYSRRIKRIFPALMVVLAATWAFAWYVLLSDEYGTFARHVAGGAGFVSNFVLWAEAGYFDADAAAKPLLHLWSLGIEEQFYIVWPLLLGFVWKRKRGFLAITVGIAAASFAVNVFTVVDNPVAAFYSPLARFWELMIGGVLAYVALHRPQLNSGYSNLKSIAGFSLIGLGIAVLDDRSVFPGGWALLPTVGAFLIVSAGPAAWLNRRVLANPAMVGIGLISYPVYLWHWPLLSFAYIVEASAPSRNFRMAAVAATFVLAWLTYYFVERNIRHQSGRAPAVALAAVATVFLVGGVFVSVGGAEPRHRGKDLELVVRAFEDWRPLQQQFDAVERDGGVYYVKHASAQTVLLLGDSHVEQYGPRVSELLNANPAGYRTVMFDAQGGCMPVPSVLEDQHPSCGSWLTRAVALAQSEDVNSVVIGACWNCYFIDMTAPRDQAAVEGDPSSYEYYYRDDGGRKYFRSGEGMPFALASLERLLRELAGRKPVYLLLDNPNGAQYHPKTFFEGTRLTSLSFHDSERVHRVTDEQKRVREELLRVAERAGATVIDPLLDLCENDICPTTLDDGSPMYKDSNHFRGTYAESHASFIDVALKLSP